MPSTAIPAKKHHVAGEGFFRSTLATARSRQRIAAANGRAEKTVMLFMMEPRGFPALSEANQPLASRREPGGRRTPFLLPPQPPQEHEQRYQGLAKNSRPPRVVHDAVDPVRP